MANPITKSVRCVHAGGFHDMVYDDWGPEDAETALLCVHGLTRNGKDFSRLAAALSQSGIRVLAPDIVGRGRSDRLGPMATYEIPQYVNDITVLLAAEGLREVDWLGTSMGGLIGFAVAAQQGHPIRRFIVNDVGPFIPASALRRIGDYVGIAWEFDGFDQGLEHIKRAYEPFGLKTEEDWRMLAEYSLLEGANGTWTNNYDIRIADPFKTGPIEDIDLWALWDAISIPTLVLRGAESDLLEIRTAEEMRDRGPKANLITFDGCGHAPALMDSAQIDVIRNWLVERE